VSRVAAFGVFIELEPGVEGLVPASENGVARDGDLKKAFPVGADADVVILEVAPTERRIRLSITGVQRAQEVDEVRAYQERAPESSADGFGSMADKLRGALGTKN
jgi:small subunit ribosomal protein S1